MTLETTLYDTADYLDSEEAVRAYLETVFEDGDPALIAHALGAVARAQGMGNIARRAGLSRERLDQALAPERTSELATLIQVMKALGLRFLTAETQASAPP